MSRSLTIAVLFVLCAIAAGVGGYVATIQSGSAAAVAPGPAHAERSVPNQTPLAAASPGGNAPAEPARSAPAELAPTPVPAVGAQVASAYDQAPAAAPVIPGYGNRSQRVDVQASRPGKPSSAATRGANAQTESNAPTHPPASGTTQPPAASLAPEPVMPPPSADPIRPTAPPAPPMKVYEEFIVPAESVLGLQLMTTVTTETSKVEDPVEAKVTRDLRVGGSVVIPAGTRVAGSVTTIEKAGKVKGRARIGVRFTMLVLADVEGTRVPIRTDAVFRESESQGEQSTSKIGAAAVGSALLGAIIGGGKGAAIGGAIGAGGGTASVLAGSALTASLPAGTAISIRLQDPVTITIER